VGQPGMSYLTQAEKFELGRKVRANGDIREGDRLLFDAALDHYSCKTGRCDPSATTLGNAVARNERTARRRLERLEAHGVLRLFKRKGRSTLIELPHPSLVATPDNYVSGPVIHNPGQMEQAPRTNGTTTPDTMLSDEPETSEREEKRHSGKGNGTSSSRNPKPLDPFPTPEERKANLAKWEEVKRRLKVRQP
jgi:hypothetical protein